MTHGLFVGLTTLDVVHQVASAPAPNQKITAAAQSVGVGGPAANAALTFAALGGEATLVTVLGASPVADVIHRELAAHGVRVLDAQPGSGDEPPVSVAAVQISSGERSVVSIDAVSTPAPVPAGLNEVMAGADVLLVDGHYPQLGIAAAKKAAAQGIQVVVDAGRWKPAMPDLIRSATDMVCSNDFQLPGRADTIPALAEAGTTRVVVTRGPEPVLWWENGRSGSVSVPPVPVADTLGAGDAFHGAYAFYAAAEAGRRLDLAGRIALAIGVATTRIGVLGPRAWLAETRRWIR
jgi:sugar/nucleoside kinase (ribokinase family)